MMNANTKNIITYLQGLDENVNVTAQDVADALGIADKRTVDGSFTSALQKKGYGVRVSAEVEMEDGTHKSVKFLKLTAAGRAFDVNAVEEA